MIKDDTNLRIINKIKDYLQKKGVELNIYGSNDKSSPIVELKDDNGTILYSEEENIELFQSSAKNRILARLNEKSTNSDDLIINSLVKVCERTACKMISEINGHEALHELYSLILDVQLEICSFHKKYADHNVNEFQSFLQEVTRNILVLLYIVRHFLDKSWLTFDDEKFYYDRMDMEDDK